MASKSATKTKPALWKRIVASVKAGTAGGRKGQWSARKAQIATARYKKAGGKGDAKKPRKKRGRYLPESVRKSLSASQKAATNRRKRAASAKGKQRAKYTKRIASKVRRAK